MRKPLSGWGLGKRASLPAPSPSPSRYGETKQQSRRPQGEAEPLSPSASGLALDTPSGDCQLQELSSLPPVPLISVTLRQLEPPAGELGPAVQTAQIIKQQKQRASLHKACKHLFVLISFRIKREKDKYNNIDPAWIAYLSLYQCSCKI